MNRISLWLLIHGKWPLFYLVSYSCLMRNLAQQNKRKERIYLGQRLHNEVKSGSTQGTRRDLGFVTYALPCLSLYFEIKSLYSSVPILFSNHIQLRYPTLSNVLIFHIYFLTKKMATHKNTPEKNKILYSEIFRYSCLYISLIINNFRKCLTFFVLSRVLFWKVTIQFPWNLKSPQSENCSVSFKRNTSRIQVFRLRPPPPYTNSKSRRKANNRKSSLFF